MSMHAIGKHYPFSAPAVAKSFLIINPMDHAQLSPDMLYAELRGIFRQNRAHIQPQNDPQFQNLHI